MYEYEYTFLRVKRLAVYGVTKVRLVLSNRKWSNDKNGVQTHKQNLVDTYLLCSVSKGELFVTFKYIDLFHCSSAPIVF